MEKKIEIRLPWNMAEIDGDKQQIVLKLDRAEEFYQKLTRALCEDKQVMEFD